MMKNDLYGKDIREIQVEIYRKTNKLYKKVLELDHGSLRNYLLSDIEEIQKDHSIVENFLITTLWLEEESKKQ